LLSCFNDKIFYHFFSLKPKGEHTCIVCTGTACYVKGAQQILKNIEQVFHLKPGETTKDNKMGIQVARCVGACGLAPVVVLDDEVQGNIVPEKFTQTMKEKMGLL
jgi:bidirectional [NiFe] hydrogenase diaphorase subunit